MLKKLCSLIMVVAMALNFGVNAQAQDFEICDWNNRSANSTLSFSGTTATCTSILEGYPGQTTRITISQTLEKKDSDGNWKYSCGWSTTIDGYKGYVTNYAYNRSKGTYRLRTDFTVYAGNDYEEITTYSFEQMVN